MTTDNDAEKMENETTGKIAGTGAGVVAGAQLGTVLIPIPIVGTFTGALVGGIVGSKIGKEVGGSLAEKLSSGKGKKDIAAELERLAKLRDQGVITEEEFKDAKARLFT